MEAPIKLFKLETLFNGVVRLQSQLPFIRQNNISDFVLRDGKLEHWEHGNKGFDFYPYDRPCKIVSDPKEMLIQEL